MAKPCIPDIATIIKMGIDPKTGLPIRMTASQKANLKEGIKRMLRDIDEEDAINRYVWYNLPANITSQEVERHLYYRGQLAFFYIKELNQFFFGAYALNGSLDWYGRYNAISVLPLNGGSTEASKKAQAAQANFFSEKVLKVKYGVVLPEDLKEEDLYDSAVLLHDRTKQLSEQVTPRQIVNDPLLDVMAECVPFMRTSLILGTGIKGMRVQDGDQAGSVWDANKSFERAALTGEPYVPIEGTIDFQELADGATNKSEEYMLAMQSLDNLRLSTYGIDNGGLFEKKAHELQTEADINGGPVGLVLQDGLSIRQNFCNIVNSIWGLGIWCEPAENITGADINGDGLMYDRNDDGAQTGTETTNTGGEEDE